MQFPDSLPAVRLQGYSRKLVTQQGRQEFLNQHRYYRRTRGSPVQDTVSWLCNADQRQTLRDFYRTIRGGAFEIRLPGHGGLVKEQAIFYANLTETPQPNQRWQISTELLIPHPSLIPATELDNAFLEYMNVTDATFAQPINDWVNVCWGMKWNQHIEDGTFADPINTFVHSDWPERV
ncbi:hypothetical protein [Endozoicomonas lisbonensis]|uniref:hypothetical protein n=1 Tax=Endozoicomonas lisbonensis TaxID=3120522 RepID=UPI003392BFE3